MLGVWTLLLRLDDRCMAGKTKGGTAHDCIEDGYDCCDLLINTDCAFWVMGGLNIMSIC